MSFTRVRMMSIIPIIFAIWTISIPSHNSIQRTNQQQVSNDQSCLTVPANFDFLHATSDQLQKYGIPPLPKETVTQQQQWVSHILPALKQRVCGQTTRQKFSQSPQITPNSLTGTNYAPNWAGYMATNGGFDFVWSDIFAPCYHPTTRTAQAAQWVGIGDGNYANLWQTGIEYEWQNQKQWAFYEAAPNQLPVVSNLSVNCGDQIALEAEWSSSNNNSYAMVADYTTGQYWSPNPIAYTPYTGTAEWIDERPACGSNYYQLADFTYTSWSYAQAESWIYGNNLEPVSYYSYNRWIMQQGSQQLVYTYPLGSDGKSFTNTWLANGPYEGC